MAHGSRSSSQEMGKLGLPHVSSIDSTAGLPQVSSIDTEQLELDHARADFLRASMRERHSRTMADPDSGEERYVPRDFKDGVDGFDWAVVFGGSKKDVDEMLSLSDPEESAIETLEQNLRDTKMLRVRREHSSDGEHVALLLGIKDEATLMEHAERMQMKKRVINTAVDDDKPGDGKAEPGWSKNVYATLRCASASFTGAQPAR